MSPDLLISPISCSISTFLFPLKIKSWEKEREFGQLPAPPPHPGSQEGRGWKDKGGWVPAGCCRPDNHLGLLSRPPATPLQRPLPYQPAPSLTPTTNLVLSPNQKPKAPTHFVFETYSPWTVLYLQKGKGTPRKGTSFQEAPSERPVVTRQGSISTCISAPLHLTSPRNTQFLVYCVT